MKRICFITLISIVCGFINSRYAFATEYEVTGITTPKVLSLDLKEKVATSAACDLYIEKFEYLADLRIFNIILAEVTNCPLDSIAPRKAHFEWNMPFNFAAVKSVYLRVNGKIIGTLAVHNQDSNPILKLRGL